MDPRWLDILHALLQSMPPGAIPSFANGGTVYEPTLAVVGDNGPEAMVPLGGQGGSPWDRQLGSTAGLDRFGAGGRMAGRAMPELNTKLNTINGGTKAQIGNLLSGGTGGNAAFSPSYLRDATRRSILTNASSQNRNAGIGASLFGLDPMQKRAALAESGRNASAGVSGALNNADLAGLSGHQDFIQRLLSGERGYQQNDIESIRAAEEAKKARGNPFAKAAGYVGGKIVNKFL